VNGPLCRQWPNIVGSRYFSTHDATTHSTDYAVARCLSVRPLALALALA